MRAFLKLLVWSLVLVLSGDKVQHQIQIIELSQTVRESIPFWTTLHEFHLIVVHNGTTKDGQWFQVDAINGSTHTGTHVDAPCHFHKGGACISEIPLTKLVAPAVVVDIRSKTSKNSDYALSVGDLQEWEQEHGSIADGSVLLVNTGWDQYWNDPVKYLGSDDITDPTKLHFPGVSYEAAQWLADNRNIVGIGVDTVSLDAGQALIQKAHSILSARSVYNLENLANLALLPAKGAMIYSMPMKLERASGAPARVIAILGENQDTDGYSTIAAKFSCHCFYFCCLYMSFTSFQLF